MFRKRSLWRNGSRSVAIRNFRVTGLGKRKIITYTASDNNIYALALLFICRVVLCITPEKRNAHLDFYSRASFDNSEFSSYFAIFVSQLPYNIYFFSLFLNREPYLNCTYRSYITIGPYPYVTSFERKFSLIAPYYMKRSISIPGKGKQNYTLSAYACIY